MNDFEQIVGSITANPEKSFKHLIYESTENDLILLLNELILVPEKGHDSVIRCLLCWQDFMDYEYVLEPVITELSQSTHEDSASACLKLLSRLIQLAPNISSRIRIRHELDELRIKDRLQQLRQQFPVSRQLAVLTEECLESLEADEQQTVAGAPHFGDFDSGMSSGNDEDIMSVGVQELSAYDLEFVKLLGSTDIKNHREQLLALLKCVVKDLADGEEQKLNALLAVCNGELTAKKPVADANANIPKSVPSPPPPPIAPPAPPPPPPPTKTSQGPPPPPPPKSGAAGCPPPPPLLMGKKTEPEKTHIPDALKLSKMPAAGKKFKRLQWSKIPASAITEQKAKNSIWQRLETVHQALKNRLDLSELDQYFECTPVTPVSTNGDAVVKDAQLELLDGKRKMNVAIFLKQFKNVDSLLKNIFDGNTDGIEQEKLKVLEGLLPTNAEILTLKNYTGELKLLGEAETFFLQLIKIPEYHLRITTMSFKVDFMAFSVDAQRQLQVGLTACDELLTSESLRKIFYLFLHMGNYLNVDGKTAGFKLNTLWGVDSLKATNKDGLSIMHLVANRMHDSVADVKQELLTVPEAAQIPLESIKDETNGIAERLKLLQKRIEAKEDPFFIESRSFLENAKSQVEAVKSHLAQIEAKRGDLAAYFLEPEKTFRLEECFKIFSTFLTRFFNAVNDNQMRLEREERLRTLNQQKRQKANEQLKKNDENQSPILMSVLTGSNGDNTLKFGATDRRRSVMCLSERERTDDSSPKIRRKFSAAVANRNSHNERSNDLDLFKSNFKTKNVPLIADTNLEEFVESALSGRRATITKPSPGSATTDKQTSEMDETISVNVPSGSSHEASEVSPLNNNTLLSEISQSPVIKSSAKKPPLPPTQKKLKPRSSVENGTSKNADSTAAKKPSLSLKAMNSALMRVRALRGTNANPTVHSSEAKTSSIPTRPSQARLANGKPPAAPQQATASPVVTISVTNPTKTNRSGAKGVAEQKTASTPSTPRSTFQRTSTFRSNSSVDKSLPRQSSLRNIGSANNTATKRQLTAGEKRSLQMKPSDSVSTASRPALIKTGSTTERPRWI